MLNYRKILQCALLICLVMVMFAAPASAADVLVTIRDRAASLLKGLKPVIFILAGFGLIGFAWMAIFDKISWKWFSNIAIGLFLVANMGIFVDYFTTKSGQGKTYGTMLGRADYKDNMGGGYQGTDGTGGDPLTQTPGSGEGAAGPSGSDELDSEYEKALAGVTDEKTCTGASGVWENGKCKSKGSVGGSDAAGYADGAAFEQELAQNKDQESCSANGGTWDKNKCVASWAAGDNGTSFTDRLDCANSGGNWDGSKCVKNTQPPSGAGTGTPGVINPPSGSEEKPAESDAQKCKSGEAWAGGQKKCVAAEEAKCYEGGGYSYSKEWGCVSRSEFQDKIANAERKCDAQEGYEYVTDKYNLSAPGSCQKTKKQGNRDCKNELGDDYEWNSSAQDCVKKEKVLKKDCKALGADYEWDKNRGECKKTAAALNNDCKSQGLYQFDNASGKCISEDEACQKKSGYIWKDGKCDTELGFAKSECDARGSDYMLNGARECVTRQSECLKSPGFVWIDGKCRDKILLEVEKCKAKGKDYKWDSKLETCTLTAKAAKKDCESKPGYFWSDDYDRCIKEE